MRPLHSYVIRVSLAPNHDGWEVQVPGLPSARASTAQQAMKLALARHIERVGHTAAQEARVFVTFEIEPDQIDDVIAGVVA
ncbi:hypothetical protein GCM10027613_19450 [Microlunatus endophyticus]